MDETKNTLAIVLNRQPYRENDLLVTVYTKEFGKKKLVARGAKKLQSKLAGHLEPLSLAEIMIVRGKNFDYLGSALGRGTYFNLKSDLNKLYYGGRALAWFDKLVKENQADERLFFLLSRWLAVLDNFQAGRTGEELSKENGELFFSFFALKLMAELGYQPELEHCLICREKLRPGKNYFDLKNGGIVGQECFSQKGEELKWDLVSISDSVIKLMRFILVNRFSQAEKIKTDKKHIKELYQIVEKFLRYDL